MSFFVWLDKGNSMPSRDSLMQSFSSWIGYKSAVRHKNVHIHKSSCISSSARINPREGEIVIGEKAIIAPGTIIQGNVRMGKNCSLQPYSIVTGYGTADSNEGSVIIGDNVRIASHVMIVGANHIFKDREKPICTQGLARKNIVIEDDVWIGGNVNIIAGVKIGKGSVIAAGAVVTGDIPPYSVAAGVPAKVLKER